MNSELLWQAFVDTGDPSYYLLYKTASDKEREEEKKKGGNAGDLPAASDDSGRELCLSARKRGWERT